jgi:hypothetical protein
VYLYAGAPSRVLIFDEDNLKIGHMILALGLWERPAVVRKTEPLAALSQLTVAVGHAAIAATDIHNTLSDEERQDMIDHAQSAAPGASVEPGSGHFHVALLLQRSSGRWRSMAF